MDHDSYSDHYIRGILNSVKTIAVVGVSSNTVRPSYFVFKYLLERGYRMIPVNPGQAGRELLGQKIYAKLADIPEAGRHGRRVPRLASTRSASCRRRSRSIRAPR